MLCRCRRRNGGKKMARPIDADALDRLTKRSNETVHENGVCCTHFGSAECNAVYANCADNCIWEETVWAKLAYYEDLEEQGRLVILPCKVGDTVYFRTYAKNATVDLGIQPHEVVAAKAYIVTKGEFTDVGHPLWQFGKTVFLTREEAEAALRGGGE